MQNESDFTFSDGLSSCMNSISKTRQSIFSTQLKDRDTVQPRYTEGPRDCQNTFAIRRFRYIEVLPYILLLLGLGISFEDVIILRFFKSRFYCSWFLDRMTLLLLFFLVLKCFNKQLTTVSVKRNCRFFCRPTQASTHSRGKHSGDGGDCGVY